MKYQALLPQMERGGCSWGMVLPLNYRLRFRRELSQLTLKLAGHGYDKINGNFSNSHQNMVFS
jgi:hypothetical protein